MNEIRTLQYLTEEFNIEMKNLVLATTEFYKNTLPFKNQYFYIRNTENGLIISTSHLDDKLKHYFTDFPIKQNGFESILHHFKIGQNYRSDQIIKFYKKKKLNDLFEKTIFPNLSIDFREDLTQKHISHKDKKMSYYDSNRGFWQYFNADINIYILSFLKYSYIDNNLPKFQFDFLINFESLIKQISLGNKSGIYNNKGSVYYFNIDQLEYSLVNHNQLASGSI